MPDLPTRLDLYAIGRNFVRARAKRIDPFQVDVEGSDINLIVGATSAIAHFLVLQLDYSVNKLLLDGADGEDLDRYAWDRYTLVRKGASAAVVQLRIYRDSAGPSGTIAVGRKIRTKTGIEYITTSVASMGTNDLVTICNASATQAGKSSQVGANALTAIDDPASLFDPSLRVNNDSPAAGGEEVQSDDQFREIIRVFWTTARRGTVGAIEFGAMQVPGIVTAKAVEALTTVIIVMPYGPVTISVPIVSISCPARVVNLYIADSTGVANQTLANSCRFMLEEYRACGITVLVNTGMPSFINIVLALVFQADIDTVTLTDAVKGAIFEYVNSIPVNATLQRSALFTVLRRFVPNGLIVSNDSIVAPAGDLVPNPGETIRTMLENITVQ